MIAELKERMKGKGADPEQGDLIRRIQEAVADVPQEGGIMDVDSIPFMNDANVATHLGADKSMQEVLELMINKLRNSSKTVDTMKKPQILMLTQNTLAVAALYKTLRDKYAFKMTKKVTRKTKKIQPEQIEVRLHKLFARHISIKEQTEQLASNVGRPVINVFLGTPGRIKALAEAGAI